jgi:hypothetical protein
VWELRTGLKLLHHAGEESGEGARVDEGAQPAMPPQETLLLTVMVSCGARRGRELSDLAQETTKRRAYLVVLEEDEQLERARDALYERKENDRQAQPPVHSAHDTTHARRTRIAVVSKVWRGVAWRDLLAGEESGYEW